LAQHLQCDGIVEHIWLPGRKLVLVVDRGFAVDVVWCGGQRKKLWVFSHTALWYSRGLPPVDIRDVLVCAPEGKLRMEAFFCTDLQAKLRQFIAEWNEVAHPFNWTTKSVATVMADGVPAAA
jgi:hypothetical protein